jgi:hypothetical protein
MKLKGVGVIVISSDAEIMELQIELVMYKGTIFENCKKKIH